MENININDQTLVQSQAESDTYFKDAFNNFVRAFKVVVETPTHNKTRTDFYIAVYFPVQHRIRKVRFLKCLPFLDDLQRAVLFAFVHQNYELATRETFEINQRHLDFCEAVGDDPSTRSELQ